MEKSNANSSFGCTKLRNLMQWDKKFRTKDRDESLHTLSRDGFLPKAKTTTKPNPNSAKTRRESPPSEQRIANNNANGDYKDYTYNCTNKTEKAND
ncbi:hypothetical protein TcasGA2_TC002820 [Tribolium castaneum]|uniref:Uncharacterized protein n=1 Tax=Tribolium castaneum TaxID=7070 RepID=D6WIA0_TRICA|nr:hypothetical protein TcasGA2_TC002820 [Tribolium castaneum]